MAYKTLEYVVCKRLFCVKLSLDNRLMHKFAAPLFAEQ